jgi:uncharacterized protein (DUF2249 family)
VILMDTEIKLDVCGLAPPEPLERVLDALLTLRSGQRLCMLIDREPHPLYPILERNGFVHQTRIRPDRLVEILIWQGR